MSPPRQLALTPVHVERLAREVPEPFPDGRFPAMDDADFDALAVRLVGELGGDPFWIFAYGSLIWKPAFEYRAARPATAYGWRRSFCMDMQEWRGTPDQPGLMLTLDRGGSCVGMAYLLPEEARLAQMRRLLTREYYYRGDDAWLRWLTLRSGGEAIRALVFYCARDGIRDVVRLPLEEQAHRLARAVGPAGSGAEYLHNTVAGLEALGIRDQYLWRLQAMVAAKIDADMTARAVPTN